MKRAFVFFLLAAGCATPPEGVTTTTTGWMAAFPDEIQRTWVGPEFWANRLQDWRIADGRLECVEGARNLPLRTMMLLTRDVEPGGRRPLRMEIRTAPLGTPGEQAFAGFLVGAGGPQVDYRISAQVHHRPAEDGGLLAVVDPAGMVQLYDNSIGAGTGGQWSIGGPLRDSELLPLRSTLVAGEGRTPSADPMRLVLEVDSSDPEDCVVTLTAYEVRGNRLLSTATATDVPARLIDGLVGLVSHRADEGAAAGGHWFDDWRIDGGEVLAHDDRAWGPLLAAQYTVSEGVLKLTMQCAPLDHGEPVTAFLSVRPRSGGPWRGVASAELQSDSWTLPFRVDDYDARVAQDFRVVMRTAIGGGFQRSFDFRGSIAREPEPDEELVVASLNCAKHFVGGLKWNGDAIWFPHAETAAHVAALEPDLLYFAGDQLYEGDLDPVDARSDDKLVLDYLYKWYRFCWSFGELTRRIPTVTVPDDHDVYQGNLWGAGGRLAKADRERGISAQDAGGYTHSARFVNVVHATQTSHLPDPVDPEPAARGIAVYFTRLVWGGVDFAILSDRMFKDSASDVLAAGAVRNGWFRDASFDPRDADVDGARLLGSRQEAFLDGWSQDWPQGVRAKAVLSQTPFVNVATIPEEAGGGEVLPSLPVPEPGAYPEGYKFAADTDSGGWPQSARDRAVDAMRRCFAVHLAGDQHLGTLVQYGIDGPRDAGYAFTSPAIANTWPRRWWPPVHGENPDAGAPHYTGDFVDGFGNPMTVWAAANPVQSGLEPAALYDRAPGYGVVRFAPGRDRMTFECWPRWVDATAPGAEQYAGWPRTISRLDNGLSEPAGVLPAVSVGKSGAVVELWMERAGADAELVYVLRVDGPEFAAPVRDADAVYRLHVRVPGDAEGLDYAGMKVAGATSE